MRDRETGQVTSVDAQVWFTARTYRCPVCGLRLDSGAEIAKAFDPAWQIENADWRDYEPSDAAAELSRRSQRLDNQSPLRVRQRAVSRWL